MAETKRYDVLILGAGPGGGAAAGKCLEAGKTVAMVESYGFGGTCPLRGCNPKKALLGPPEAMAMVEGVRSMGLRGELSIHWPELMAFKRTFTEGLADRIRSHYEEKGAATFFGKARFVGDREVEVETDDGVVRLVGEHVVVSTGQRERDLDVPGKEHVSSSDDFLELDELPGRIVFIGGGFISFEYAHIAQRAGAQCTILHRSERVLKPFDADLSKVLVQASRELGIDVRTETPLHSITARPGGSYLVRGCEDAHMEVKADMVVHGAGRVPDLGALDPAASNIAWNKHGVEVDEYMRSTSNPKVFAAGDCADTPYALTPTADLEGTAVGENIVGGLSRKVSHQGIPSVCYSLPPLMAVGALEEQLQERGVPFEKKEHDLSDWFSWKRLGDKHARAKVLVSPDDGRVLGAHMVGHEAQELSNIFAVLVRLGLPRKDLDQVLWSYPTCGYYVRYMY
ncbi:dihydrolipoyl dehydrogenase family protein [Desulfohalovibrio reitneri]|uniref:dihydrolipoyl dehydrogenase family protein n=1 Tax=Desulfohalovibrio reitneri TaxID=1307759 RepID=UPI0004A763ED|nr:NAD(P)/FAD-dependent oxidoreductase [Desulfohalovibrio reitneri]